MKPSRNHLLIGLSIVAVLIGIALYIYLDDSAPPSHPESNSVYTANPVVKWLWSGAVTSDGAVVKARLPVAVSAQLAVQDSPALDAPRFFDGIRMQNRQEIVQFTLSGLEPDTSYYYALALNDVLDSDAGGQFHTVGEGAYSFTIALGACASTGSNGAVFDTIRSHDPLFFLHLGDLHYENIIRNDPDRFHEAYNRVLAAPAQSLLYRAYPIVYIWDDHDFGPNNSSSWSPAAEAARQAYEEAVPHYPLLSEQGIQQAFSVGRVRFILTDARSQRSARQATILGAEQKAWFKQELLRSFETHALIVWVNSVPWVGVAPAFSLTREDNWAGYREERNELADFLVAEGIDNLIMVSGDAHMLAMDDGSNTNYATAVEGRAFPLLHAAALDREGSTKGGPYTLGPFPGGGQFAVMSVTDAGDKLHVSLTGYDYLDNQLLGVTLDVGPEGISNLTMVE